VREALRTLEREGQVTYLPRRGYFTTAVEIDDLKESYELRAIVEARAARRAVEALDEAALTRIELTAGVAPRRHGAATSLPSSKPRRFISRSSRHRAATHAAAHPDAVGLHRHLTRGLPQLAA
jgi:DNA-binding GntR family transcriptional regulator